MVLVEEEREPAGAVRHVEDDEGGRDDQQQDRHVVVAMTAAATGLLAHHRLMLLMVVMVVAVMMMMMMMMMMVVMVVAVMMTVVMMIVVMVVMVVAVMMMMQTEDIMMRRPRLSGRLFVTAGGVQLITLAGATSDSAEYRRVESDDDEHGSHDRPDDQKRHVEADVDVSPVGQHVAVGQLTVRPVSVDDADGERRKAGKHEARDGLGQDDATSVRHGDDQ